MTWFRTRSSAVTVSERSAISGRAGWRSGPLWLAGIVLLFVAVDARWIWLYRHGGIYDIDEAGYLGLALTDYQALLKDGFASWLAAINAPSIQAPMTMVLTSLIYVLAGPHVIASFIVTVAAGAGCILSANALGQTVASRRAGLIAAIITASCPVIVNYSRSYQFSMLATLTTTLTLVALLRSRGFRSTAWSLAFGIGFGLMPLARTMQLAFMPGMLAAAGIVVLVGSDARKRRLLMLLAACLAGTFVAASWFWSNGVRVAQYLLNFGYGAQAAEYGPHASRLGADAWVATAQAFVAQIFLPHLLLIGLGCVVAWALLCCRLARPARRETVNGIARSSMLPVCVFLASAMIALTSSGNKGTGFFAPLIPGFAALVGWSFDRACRSWAVWIVVGVAMLAAIPQIDLWTPFAREWSATLPMLGNVPITNGAGTIQTYESVAGYGLAGDPEPVDRMASRAWNDASVATAAILVRLAGEKGGVAFGFRNALYNVNTINLQDILHQRTMFSGRMVEPTLTGQTVAGYLGWMRRETTDACVLLTSDRAHGDFAPPVDRSMMDKAAVVAGFVRTRAWRLPDGQSVVLWKHAIAPPRCPR